MNPKGNLITSSKKDDDMLTTASEKVYNRLFKEYWNAMPDGWQIILGTKRIEMSDIKKALTDNRISEVKAESYYGGTSGIETDAHIIYLEYIENEKQVKRPIFIGEMKKQGTNDTRIAEGKDKQGQGNAVADRIAKAYVPISNYCFLNSREFFPYCVFIHGCDYSESEITKTSKAKITPLFGELNKLNPFFDKDMLIIGMGPKGGTCFYQGEEYTMEQLESACYECAKYGLDYYLSYNKA